MAKCFTYQLNWFWILIISCIFSCNQPSQKAAALPEIYDLPKWTWPALEQKRFKDSLVFDTRINPYYLQADFDRDGFTDIAILVKRKMDEQQGFVLLKNSDKEFTLLNNSPEPEQKSNLNWLRTWKTERVLPAGADVQSQGEVIILFPEDVKKPAVWLYWNGQAWQWQSN